MSADANPRLWICLHCRSEQTHDAWCELCYRGRYASHAIQLAHHITEHLADGITEPLAMLEAMQARPCYARFNAGSGFTLAFITQQMRLLTKDTTAIAQQIVKARSARAMLEVLEDGDPSVKVRVLEKWGPKTNAEQHDHNVQGNTIVKHVYEQLPPKGDA